VSISHFVECLAPLVLDQSWGWVQPITHATHGWTQLSSSSLLDPREPLAWFFALYCIVFASTVQHSVLRRPLIVSYTHLCTAVMHGYRIPTSYRTTGTEYLAFGISYPQFASRMRYQLVMSNQIIYNSPVCTYIAQRPSFMDFIPPLVL